MVIVDTFDGQIYLKSLHKMKTTRNDCDALYVCLQFPSHTLNKNLKFVLTFYPKPYKEGYLTIFQTVFDKKA